MIWQVSGYPKYLLQASDIVNEVVIAQVLELLVMVVWKVQDGKHFSLQQHESMRQRVVSLSGTSNQFDGAYIACRRGHSLA